MTVHRLNPMKANVGSQTATGDYVRRVKIACDDLHGEPLNPAARAVMLKLVEEEEEDVPSGPLSW